MCLVGVVYLMPVVVFGLIYESALWVLCLCFVLLG